MGQGVPQGTYPLPRHLPPTPQPDLMGEGAPQGTYPPSQGTTYPPGQDSIREYLIRRGRCASCVHAGGGLSCFTYDFPDLID